MVGKFWNFTSNYCTIAIVNITSIQLGVIANHLDYLRVPTHALGLVALSSAGFTHRAGMSLSPGCYDGSFLFVFLAWGHLIFAFFRRIIYSLAFLVSLEPFFTLIFMGLMTDYPPSSIVEEIRSKKTIVNKVQGELETKTTVMYRKRQTQ